MPKTREARGGQDAYLDLVRRFPLRPIRTDAELDRATGVVDGLLDRKRLTRGERDYLDVLSDQIERYESAEIPIPPASDGEVLRHLLETRGLSQAAVARENDIPGSTVSELLAGKRRLTRAQVGKLARFFNVGPTAFGFDG